MQEVTLPAATMQAEMHEVKAGPVLVSAERQRAACLREVKTAGKAWPPQTV